MTGRWIGLAALAGALWAAAPASAAPVSEDEFQVTNTAQLVSLCGADRADPLYTPARNFCEGFVVATYRAMLLEEAASRSRHKMFCLSPGTRSRDQTVADFVQWASNRASTMASSPTDGVVEYFVAQYPCP